jgi:cyclopropane fatty-acyl-phospholipid synthase-like methyltransferase
MSHPLSALIDKHLGAGFLPRLKQQVLGLAEDFWKDGPENLLNLDLNAAKLRGMAARKAPVTARHPARKNPEDAPVASQPAIPARDPNLWHAEPGEISEKMWGDGFVTPGGSVISGMLIKPLGLTKEMSVLDLSAGLGGRIRRTAEETGAYVTGLEPDASVAERGMQLSVKAGKSKHAPITHYVADKLALNRSYDCIIARETFYRMANRSAFFAKIGQHTKPRGQIAFTDYIVNPEHRDHPAILAWKNFEKNADPPGLVELAEAWAKAGFNLRVNEDLTEFYKTEVRVGLKRLMQFLVSGIQPDEETSYAVLRRIETWKYRMAAMDAGMKFHRFYGTKQ